MTNHKQMIQNVAGSILLAAVLAGCAKQAPPPEPVPAAEPATAPATAPDDVTIPASTPDPADAPPNEPSTTPPPVEPPAALNDPALESMQLARPSAKIGVAADVRYRLEGPLAQGQSATLHLAVVPRIAGAPVNVSIKEVPGLSFAAGAANIQKVDSRDVIRRQYAVTRSAASATQIRVLVTMQVGEDTGFGFFTIPLESPLDGQLPAKKLDSVKQR
jgi:hypothetical protein